MEREFKHKYFLWFWLGALLIFLGIVFFSGQNLVPVVYEQVQLKFESDSTVLVKKIAEFDSLGKDISSRQLIKKMEAENELNKLKNRLTISSFYFIWYLICIILGAFLFWNRKMVVPPNWNYLFEFFGRKVQKFEPGIYFLFIFGLKPKGMVQTNVQTLKVLSGSEEGIKKEILGQHPYGLRSDIEPSDGEGVRITYNLEIKCIDPCRVAYFHETPYEHLVSLIEASISRKFKEYSSENISDTFLSEDWRKEVLSSIMPSSHKTLGSYFKNSLGIEVLKITPTDVILNPKAKEAKEREEVAKRQKNIYIAETDAAGERQKLQAKNDEITKNTISVIKNTAGVNGNKVLDYMATNKKLETMETVSKNGANTFIDGSGGGSFAGGTGFGWGFNSQNKSKPNSDGKAENDEKKDDKKLEVKKTEKKK